MVKRIISTKDQERLFDTQQSLSALWAVVAIGLFADDFKRGDAFWIFWLAVSVIHFTTWIVRWFTTKRNVR